MADGVGLDGVDNIDLKTFVKQEAVQGEPIVAGRFHPDDDVFPVWVVRREISYQFLAAVRSVCESKGFSDEMAVSTDDGGFVLVLPDVDSADEHGNSSRLVISDSPLLALRTTASFDIRHAPMASCAIQLIRRLPQR